MISARSKNPDQKIFSIKSFYSIAILEISEVILTQTFLLCSMFFSLVDCILDILEGLDGML